MALLSKKLATIITNAPVEFHVEDFKLKDWDKEKLKEIFAELEFKTLGKRLLGDEFSIAAAGNDFIKKNSHKAFRPIYLEILLLPQFQNRLSIPNRIFLTKKEMLKKTLTIQRITM